MKVFVANIDRMRALATQPLDGPDAEDEPADSIAIEIPIPARRA
jgi:hypothetical protein